MDVIHLDHNAVEHRAQWRTYVDNHADATVFHGLAWLDAVHASFPHRPHYLMVVSSGRVTGVLPLFEVRSMLGGTLLISVPYAVYGGALVDEQASAIALLDAVRRLADRRGARMVDLRSRTALWSQVEHVERYVTFVKQLPECSGDVLKTLPRKARAEARRARERFKLGVRFESADIDVVWALYSRSMRRLGSPNVPRRFFHELIAAMPRHHIVSVITHEGRPVAGLLSFIHRDTVMPYYVGADDSARSFGANNYVYATLMEHAVDHGWRTFDFGRSRVDNQGSYDFKKNQGFEPQPLGYQMYVPAGKAAPNLTPGNPRFRMAQAIWRRLPLPVTRPLGAWLSASIPG